MLNNAIWFLGGAAAIAITFLIIDSAYNARRRKHPSLCLTCEAYYEAINNHMVRDHG